MTARVPGDAPAENTVGALQLSRWFSPSQSFLQLVPVETASACSTTLTINATVSAPAVRPANHTLHYQVSADQCALTFPGQRNHAIDRRSHLPRALMSFHFSVLSKMRYDTTRSRVAAVSSIVKGSAHKPGVNTTLFLQIHSRTKQYAQGEGKIELRPLLPKTPESAPQPIPGEYMQTVRSGEFSDSLLNPTLRVWSCVCMSVESVKLVFPCLQRAWSWEWSRGHAGTWTAGRT